MLRKWATQPKTRVLFSFDAIENALSIAGVGTPSLENNETGLRCEGSDWNAVVDLRDCAFDFVGDAEALKEIGKLGILPEYLKLLLRNGDACTLTARSERPA